MSDLKYEKELREMLISIPRSESLLRQDIDDYIEYFIDQLGEDFSELIDNGIAIGHTLEEEILVIKRMLTRIWRNRDVYSNRRVTRGRKIPL